MEIWPTCWKDCIEARKNRSRYILGHLVIYYVKSDGSGNSGRGRGTFGAGRERSADNCVGTCPQASLRWVYRHGCIMKRTRVVYTDMVAE